MVSGVPGTQAPLDAPLRPHCTHACDHAPSGALCAARITARSLRDAEGLSAHEQRVLDTYSSWLRMRVKTSGVGHAWFCSGSRVGPGWVQDGSRVGPGWIQGGSMLGSQWVQDGCKVGPGWGQGGSSMGLGWVQNVSGVGMEWV